MAEKTDTLNEKTKDSEDEIIIDIKEAEKNSDKKNERLEKLQKKTSDKLAKEIIKLEKKISSLNDELEKKTIESNDFLDKYKRSLADMENLRKRSVIDRQDNLKYGNFRIIEDLVIILDDFQRAIDHAKESENVDLTVFTEGIEMIEKQFSDLLFKKHAVESFGEEGDEFDPNRHKAMMVEDGDYKHETILQVFSKGYLLHDRVIKAAQVKVGKPV